MAPTGSVAADVPTKTVLSAKNGAEDGAKSKTKDGAERDDKHCDSLPRMTPELLQKMCKERGMWTQAHLNTQLYLNYKGFLSIEGLEDYANVRSLHLDNNNICKIEGLDRMTQLRSLHLGSNRIATIENLENNIELRQLNLESNSVTRVTGLRCLLKLENLNLSGNQVVNLDDISELRECPALSNIDMSANLVEVEEGVVEFWSEFKNLKMLRFHGNPVTRHISHYRKRIVNALPKLTYMDDRPIFPVERKSFKAWEEGGMEAMHQAKKDFHKERHAIGAIEEDRRELITARRKTAIERLDREAAEKKQEEEDEAARVLADKMSACIPLGAGKDATSGDWEALKDWEKGWMKKKALYGEEGVRDKMREEMGGMPFSKTLNPSGQVPAHLLPQQRDSSTAQQTPAAPGGLPGGSAFMEQAILGGGAPREYEAADFDFVPPVRGSMAPVLPETRSSRPERVQAVVSDFRVQRSGGEEDNHFDRMCAAFGDDAKVDTSDSPDANGAAPGASAGSRTKAQSMADNTTMPILWQERQAEVAAAEAECMAQQERVSDACREDRGPAMFRSNDFNGLD